MNYVDSIIPQEYRPEWHKNLGASQAHTALEPTVVTT